MGKFTRHAARCEAAVHVRLPAPALLKTALSRFSADEHGQRTSTSVGRSDGLIARPNRSLDRPFGEGGLKRWARQRG
jgi:hypothetical protein